MNVVQVLDMGISLMIHGLMAADQYKALQDRLADMAGRDPTPEEWAEVTAMLKSDAARIKSVAERARAKRSLPEA